MKTRVTLIPGDGIGPEIMEATRVLIDAVTDSIEWEIKTAGLTAIETVGELLPTETLDSIRANKLALKGPITTPIGKGFRSINVALRQEFKLYGNVRPVKSFEGVDSLYKNIDMVIVRENTEDLYKGIEYMATPDVAESIKVITREASERIAGFAYEYAVKNGRKKVTTSHKANIMKLSDGLFLESSRKVGKKFPDIVTDDVIIDAMCMKLVMNPMDFDIILAPNLYGDILSDLAAGLIGGIGMAPSVNIGDDTAIFEPVHGSAPDIAGKGIANPTAAILSGVMLLRHLGLTEEAGKLEQAITSVLADKALHTKDLGGNLTTKEFTEEIKKRL